LFFSLSFEEAQQSLRMGSQQLLAAQIADDAVARAAVIPKGLDQADVFVDLAIGAFDAGGSEVHYVSLSIGTHMTENMHRVKVKPLINTHTCAPMTGAGAKLYVD